MVTDDVVGGATGRLEGEFGGEGKFGRVDAAISTRGVVADVVIYPFEGDFEGEGSVGG